MTARLLFLELEGCKFCKDFKDKQWPVILNVIEKDPELNGRVTSSIHTIRSGGSYNVPLPSSMDGVAGKNYPILIALGPDEDRAPYKIVNKNIFPARVISRGVIVNNPVKLDDKVTPLSWSTSELKSKLQNYSPPSPPQVKQLSPGNRQVVNQVARYVYPGTSGRIRSSQL